MHDRSCDQTWSAQISRIFYRIRQFLRGFGAQVTAQEWAVVQAWLSPPEQALFLRMPSDAQHHSLEVLRTLALKAPVPGELGVAALLHDAGKVAARDAGAYLGLWMRGPIVIIEALTPTLLDELGSPVPSGSLRYALYVQREHPAIGAEWARQAGASELSCWLIEHHQDKQVCGSIAQQTLLARLQWADGRN
ncbi:MAG: HD domain-containing protein [Anaerolineales bacterium]|nr:HD domain-containing protein [Anaerolineales bacterium]